MFLSRRTQYQGVEESEEIVSLHMEDIAKMQTFPAEEYLTPGSVLDYYSVSSRLGAGAFALVRLGRSKVNPDLYSAIKVILPRVYANPQQRAAAIREVAILKKVSYLNHPNLLSFYSAHEDISASTGLPRLAIATEYCSGGELFDSIVAAGHYSEHQTSVVIGKLADALRNCHKAGIIHRDLKPENILLRDRSPDAEPVLADFGLALLEGEVDQFPGISGTYAYVSPEIIQHRQYSTAGDAWSLGVLTYILLCGYPPFYAENNNTQLLFQSICSGSYYFHDENWASVSAEAKDLVRGLLKLDPKERMTLNDVLNHPFIKRSVPISSDNRPKVVENLRHLTARMRLRATAAAVVWGVGRYQVLRDLRSMLTGKVPSGENMEQLLVNFRKVAGDRDCVNLELFIQVCEMSSLKHLPLERLFSIFDVDGSGDVDYREVLTGLTVLRKSDNESLSYCFRILDSNGDGYITKDELTGLLSITGYSPNSELLSSDMTQLGDIDSVADKINPHLELIFRKMDTNNDGKISFDEFQAAVADPVVADAIWHPLRPIVKPS